VEGFIGRRGLLADERLRTLTQRSDLEGWRQTLSHFGAILATGIGLHLSWGSVWAAPLFVAHGMLLNYLFAAQHEFNHYTAFRTRWLNDVFNRVTGFLVLYPRDYERWYHFQHHRHTQDWDKDPELMGRAPYTLGSYLLYLSGISYWIGRVRRLGAQVLGEVSENFFTRTQRRAVIREARSHVAAYALVAGVSLWLESWFAVSYWLAPLLMTKTLHQVQNITEHTGITHEPDTVHNTRTIRTWPVLRWMAWNMQYHTAHHTYPAVPFHQLPALHRDLCRRLGYDPPTTGYLAFQRRFLSALWRGPEPVAGESEVATSDPHRS
jgi:fatty acid desaturase